jgi:hypothetical protein
LVAGERRCRMSGVAGRVKRTGKTPIVRPVPALRVPAEAAEQCPKPETLYDPMPDEVQQWCRIVQAGIGVTDPSRGKVLPVLRRGGPAVRERIAPDLGSQVGIAGFGVLPMRLASAAAGC